MRTELLKKRALTRMVRLASNLSDEKLIRMVELSQRHLMRGVTDERVRFTAEKIKKLFEEKHPATELAKSTFRRVSKESRKRIVENFFINAGVSGRQRQEELKRELGFGMPWFFVISPTAKCNLKCKGCYAGEYTKSEDLSFELVDRIFTEAKELGMYFITISGGEPYMWPPLLDIFRKHSDMFFQTYTNGTLLTKDMAQKLAKLGNVAPAISVEGFEKETDDRRGNGVFQRVMDAMDNLREAGVVFGYSVTPTRLNSELLVSDEFVDLMIQKGCVFGWYFQYVPIGRKPDVSLMATPEQRNYIRQRTKEIRNTKPIFIGDFWNDGPIVGGCLAGARHRGYFHINCKGDVEPCVFLQFSVDNIKDKKLLDVIQSPFFRAIQDAQPYCENKNLLTPCALIDNPQVLRDVVKQHNARPSYNSSYEVISNPDVCNFLDAYSSDYKKITDPIWENEVSLKYQSWKERFS